MGNFRENSSPSCQFDWLIKVTADVRRHTGALSAGHYRFPVIFNPEHDAITDGFGNSYGPNTPNNSTEEPALFWIDTLCIPVSPKYHKVRSTAINRMAQIYSGALAVLLLDEVMVSMISARQPGCIQQNGRSGIRCSIGTWSLRCLGGMQIYPFSSSATQTYDSRHRTRWIIFWQYGMHF